MKVILIVSLLFLSNIAFAQQAAPPPASNVDPSVTVTKVVKVRYGIAGKIAELVTGGMPAMVKGDNALNVIILRGAPNLVASLEQTIRELDVPGTAQTARLHRNIELVVAVIGGSEDTELSGEERIPEALAPVVKQLRAVFPYKNYQLLSSMLLRSSEGAPSANTGVMKNLTSRGNLPHVSGYGFSVEAINVSSEEGKPNIHLRNFQFKTSVPTSTSTVPNTTQWQNNDIIINTQVDLREGDKVVVGKANVGNSDLALFVVLTARLVE